MVQRDFEATANNGKPAAGGKRIRVVSWLARTGKGDARMSVDDTLKRKIDRWIEETGRNHYGDESDTMYLGGTPLFDERTGKTKDRYDYILEKHPELRRK
jgi:hypothetical protein